MTPAQLVILKTEVSTDPKGLGYAACLPNCPGHLVDLMNAPTQSMVQQISAMNAMKWAATGPYAAIVDASNNTNSQARASCLVVRDTLVANLPIDLTDASVLSMFSGWVAASVITQAQHDALMTAATLPASRAQVLGLPAVQELDLMAAFE